MKFSDKIGKLYAIVVIALLCGSLTLFSATPKKEKLSTQKGAQVTSMQGTTRYWKDVSKIPLNELPGPRRMRPIKNFEYERPIVRKSTHTDPVVQRSFTVREAKHPGTSLMPSTSKNFAGMDLNNNGMGWPPDTNGDVGIDHYIQTVNTSIGIYRKSDGGLVSAASFDNFFGGTGITGTPCDADNNGDPIVLFDTYAQRWFILDFAWAPSESDGSYFAIAVSKTSDPTGAWWQYAFRADNTLMNDYPKVGIWGDGIYITANMFQFSGSFQGVKVWALKKPDIYSGTLTSQYIYDTTYYAWAIMPANAQGATAPPAGAPNYMYTFDTDEWGGTDSLKVWKYHVDWTTPANTTWTGPASMATAAFVYRSARVPQSGTAVTLDTLGSRLMYAGQYRNFGTHESVYLTHTVDVSGVAAMRWYELRISGGVSSIYQQGTFSPDTHHRWMGSIAADKYGNIGLAYSVSSSSLFPSIRYAGRQSSDPLGVLSQGEASIIEGSGSQTDFNRWGDYSMMTIDPTDDETFWYTTEYYSVSGNNWQTRIASFKFNGDSSFSDLRNPDFNRDGQADIIWRNNANGQNQVWYMNSIAKTSVGIFPTTANNDWRIAGTADFNKDGKVDVLWRNSVNGGNVIWYMDNYNRLSTATLPTTVNNAWNIYGTGDFNKDGNVDILWRNNTTGANLVWYMNNSTRLGTNNLPATVNQDWKIVGTGDFNRDGKVDVVWRNAVLGKNVIWYMNNVTRLGVGTLPDNVGANLNIVGIGDFNGDNKLDILWRNTSTGANSVWYMNNTAQLSTAALETLADTAWEIVN